MLNEQLLDTPVVKSQLRMWFYEWKLSFEEVIYKLADMHLIIVNKEFLINFIKEKSIFTEEEFKKLK